MDTRVALIGPGRSFRGGIAEHTTALARRLHESSMLSEHASWGRQFPRRLHPGNNSSDTGSLAGVSATPAYPYESSDLHWDRPDSWIRVAKRLRRDAQLLVVVVSSPLQMPAVVTLSRVFRGRSRKNVTAIVHNVLPHETVWFGQTLMRTILREFDTVLVHSREQADLATALGAKLTRIASLPFHPPEGLQVGRHPAGEQRMDALAFIGFVRRYKGLDVLLEALSHTKTKPQLIIRGEFWESLRRFESLIERLGLSERVSLNPGYASATEMSGLLGSVDALVLPYRSGTGSQQPRIGFARGVPAIVTDVGDLAGQIADDVDGLIAIPNNFLGIAHAIDNFYTDNRWLRLRRNVTLPNADKEWNEYLEALHI